MLGLGQTPVLAARTKDGFQTLIEALLIALKLCHQTLAFDKFIGARQLRKAFGQAIGSFQAIKHQLADLLVACEAAKSAVYYAACTVDEYRAGTASARDLAEAAALVRSCCSEAFMQCGASAIQLHGGIGFTWEHEAQLYFKRARSAMTRTRSGLFVLRVSIGFTFAPLSSSIPTTSSRPPVAALVSSAEIG